MAKRNGPPARHSDSSAEKAAQLREIAAKVREVAGACNDDGVWSACIAIGPLFKEAYEAGAWQREGSQIGDKLKRISTDRKQLLNDGQTPVWKLEAWNAVVGPLVEHLIPVDGGEKANLEFEAGIAADEIEEEAMRIEAGGPEAPAGSEFDYSTAHSPDFRSVRWFGECYSFTPNQAAAVCVLWVAWKNGTPDVGDATVLEATNSNAERLPLVFRDHAAWGTMIVPGATKGTHRIADHAE